MIFENATLLAVRAEGPTDEWDGAPDVVAVWEGEQRCYVARRRRRDGQGNRYTETTVVLPAAFEPTIAVGMRVSCVEDGQTDAMDGRVAASQSPRAAGVPDDVQTTRLTLERGA